MPRFMIRTILLLSLSIGSLKICAQGLAGTGLEISVSGDMVYDQGFNKDSFAKEKLGMRGAEIMLYAPIDHLYEGVLSAAAHDENGETVFELHELFMSSSKLIPQSNIKAGQFFLGIGRLNRFHQHDWPFTRAPKVHRTFFDEEGVFDAGLEYSRVIPSSPLLNVTAGVTSGYRYGHSHTEGSKPKIPTHYSRLSTFFPRSSTGGLDLGFNYLGRTDANDHKVRLFGLDLTMKHRQNRQLKNLLQIETWLRSEKSPSSALQQQVGLYVFDSLATGDQMSVGFRIDAFKDLRKRDSITSKKINNISYGINLQTTYQPSEFSKIRASLSHEFEREEGTTIAEDTRATLQFVFIIGSHPAHDF